MDIDEFEECAGWESEMIGWGANYEKKAHASLQHTLGDPGFERRLWGKIVGYKVRRCTTLLARQSFLDMDVGCDTN